jgi:GTP cyclohydrolase I
MYDIDPNYEPEPIDELTQATAEWLQTVLPYFDWEGNQHLADTPQRLARTLVDLTAPEEFRFTTFMNDEPRTDQMIVSSQIPFYSLCAHHIIPFVGRAHVAYIPQDRICGLSKLARTVQHFSRGLTIQEILTSEVADFLESELVPVGVGVVFEAEHLCMSMRGAQAAGAMTTTSAMRGVFLDPMKQARQEFLSLIGKGR